MRVKISVIVPIYNTRKYLLQCVKSLQNQTIRDIEIILVDDESPDGAGILCDQMAMSDNRIRVIHKKNGGLGFARNSGLEIATEEYVAFLDSDDYVSNDYYEKLILQCERNACDICVANGFFQFSESGITEIRFKNIAQSLFNSNKSIRLIIPRLISRKASTDDNIPGTAWMSVYRKDFLDKYKIVFPSERDFISEDVWFNMECLYNANSIYYSDTVGYWYRYNENSLSRGYNQKRFKLLIHSVRMLLDKCEKMKLSDYYERVALYYWVNFEKCINQEVRYSDRRVMKFNIAEITENELSYELIGSLSKDGSFAGIHALLCRLLYHKKYALTILLLRLYNGVVHK